MNKTFVWIGVVLVVVVIGGIFALGSGKSGSTATGGDGSSNTATKTINIDAERFQFTPNAITVNKGDHVKLVVNNKDTTHGIVIPDLGVSGIDTLEFTANQTGTFEFRCPTMCGSGHRNMTGTLIVK